MPACKQKNTTPDPADDLTTRKTRLESSLPVKMQMFQLCKVVGLVAVERLESCLYYSDFTLKATHLQTTAELFL